MPKHYLPGLLLAAVLLPSVSFSQFTNRGTDFWVGFPPTGGVVTTMKLYISSQSVPANVTVTSNNSVKTYVIPANTTTVSDNISTAIQMSSAGMYNQKAVHVVSDVPVSAYVHMYGSANSGSTMLLPTNIWGTEHYILNITQNYGSNNYSVFHFVASRTAHGYK